MRSIFSTLATLLWSLWFGGIIVLFLFVQTLFNVRHALASEANPVLFDTFERYQLLVGAGALVCTFGWFMADRSRRVIVVFVLLGAAALAGVASTLLITPTIAALQREDRTKTSEFRKAHGQSMMLYTTQAALLLAAGVVLPAAVRRRADAAPADVSASVST